MCVTFHRFQSNLQENGSQNHAWTILLCGVNVFGQRHLQCRRTINKRYVALEIDEPIREIEGQISFAQRLRARQGQQPVSFSGLST